jgi:hypothetical protein
LFQSLFHNALIGLSLVGIVLPVRSASMICCGVPVFTDMLESA